ncbi:MAG TPA: nucleotidyltransferase [Bacteroidales bacterium]|nr:nucleotidyltransferase [Bacteroidales bacterium]
MHRILIDNIENLKAVCLKYPVKSLYAFGSVCTEKFNDHSDIDLLISLKPMDYGDYADTYFELVEKFENIFKRPVDLITDKSLGNPYFIESINQTKTPIYEA